MLRMLGYLVGVLVVLGFAAAGLWLEHLAVNLP